jgi:YspA, cpYpsA-related SLOG family
LPAGMQDVAAVMLDPYRVLVTGSRTWDDQKVIFNALAEYNYGQVTLVHGTARGADTIAAKIAAAFGWQIEPHPADWNSGHGKAAGFIRNIKMVELGADVCLAFIKDGSRGATHCADLAEKAGIPVRRFTQ